VESGTRSPAAADEPQVQNSGGRWQRVPTQRTSRARKTHGDGRPPLYTASPSTGRSAGNVIHDDASGPALAGVHRLGPGLLRAGNSACAAVRAERNGTLSAQGSRARGGDPARRRFARIPVWYPGGRPTPPGVVWIRRRPARYFETGPSPRFRITREETA